MCAVNTLNLLEQARKDLETLTGQLTGEGGAALVGGSELDALGYAREFGGIAEELRALQIRFQETWSSFDAARCASGK